MVVRSTCEPCLESATYELRVVVSVTTIKFGDLVGRHLSSFSNCAFQVPSSWRPGVLQVQWRSHRAQKWLASLGLSHNWKGRLSRKIFFVQFAPQNR